jgi:hypothetical protein
MKRRLGIGLTLCCVSVAFWVPLTVAAQGNNLGNAGGAVGPALPHAPSASFASAPTTTPAREPSFLSGSINVGLGVPYGGLGGGATFGFDYFAVIAGAGTELAGIGWSVGARVYLMGSGRKLRPHLSAVYGTTGMYRFIDVGGDNFEGTVNGFAFYAGLDHDVGQPGRYFMTYGIGVVTHGALPQEVEARVGSGHPPNNGILDFVLVGLGYRFGGAARKMK